MTKYYIIEKNENLDDLMQFIQEYFKKDNLTLVYFGNGSGTNREYYRSWIIFDDKKLIETFHVILKDDIYYFEKTPSEITSTNYSKAKPENYIFRNKKYLKNLKLS
jgi:hypothetical protein